MNKGKQNRSNFALSETKHSEESTTATSRMHARTHIRTESGVQHAGLYRGGVRLPKLEGKVERVCAQEGARAAPDQVDSQRTPAGATRALAPVCNSTVH